MKCTKPHLLIPLTLLVVLLIGCPPPRRIILVEPADNAQVPTPADFDQLAASFFSPDKQALISVFPGTTLPQGGLSVRVADTSMLPPALANQNPAFALNLGPDGTQFNMPVRVSAVIGKVVDQEDGSSLIPDVEVLTTENKQAVSLENVETEITGEGLVIVHALMPHFSNAAYRVKDGLRVSIDSPPDKDKYIVGSTIDTQMTAENTSDEDIWSAEPVEGVSGDLGSLQYDKKPAQLSKKGDKAVIGKGTCNCASPGDGDVTFIVKASGSSRDSGKKKSATWLKQRSVECYEVFGQMKVSFDPEIHTTFYEAKVFLNDGDKFTDITNDSRVKITWRLQGSCTAGFEGLAGSSRARWDHTDCSAEHEAATRIICDANFKDGPIDFTPQYNQPARANEGKTVNF